MPDDETVGMSNPSVPLPTVPLIEAADRPVRWMTTPDDDTETLAEVLAAHQWVWRTFQQRSFLACQCGDELIPATSSGVATLADHRNHVAHLIAARIVQARAGEGALREELLAEVERDLLNLSWSDVARFAIVKVIRNVRDRHDVALTASDGTSDGPAPVPDADTADPS